MQRAKEIDVTNSNLNVELTEKFGFSLMSKSSEIKGSITGIFPSLCLFCN